jgi:hypothetical protein
MSRVRVYAWMADEFGAELARGSDLGELIDRWLAERWSPVNVIQAAHESTDLPLDAAHDLVRRQLDGDRAAELDAVWRDAQQALGPTPDATLSGFLDPGSDGSTTAREMDFDDAHEAFAVEQVRELAADEAIDWLQSQIRRIGPACRPLAQLDLLVKATDALACPAAIVPTMLQLARWADAAQCRYPLAVVRRSHGNAPIEKDIAELRKGSPAERSTASQWAYWQRTDR